MNLDEWLAAAVADAERRGLPDLKPLLETLARSSAALRSADFNSNATGLDTPREPAVQSRR